MRPSESPESAEPSSLLEVVGALPNVGDSITTAGHVITKVGDFGVEDIEFLDGFALVDERIIRCSEDPRKLAGQPIGMYHCPGCGCMLVAGLPHLAHDLEGCWLLLDWQSAP